MTLDGRTGSVSYPTNNARIGAQTTDTSVKRALLSHSEIDRTLNGFAADPERFEPLTRAWIEVLERDEPAIETRSSVDWRQPCARTRERTAADPLYSDVQRIQVLERGEELSLARRIEFARWRFEAARRNWADEHQDLTEADPAEVGRLAAAWWRGAEDQGLPPTPVLRRAAELHALRTEMVERSLHLVFADVGRYTRRGHPRSDLVQEGAAALYRAVDRFDWRRGVLFRTYAVHWVRQAFRSYVYNSSRTVRLPNYLHKALQRVRRAQNQLGDPAATYAEIARVGNLPEGLVQSAISAARSCGSLEDTVVGDKRAAPGGATPLRDLLVCDHECFTDDPFASTSLEDGITRAIDRLTDRDQLVVRMRFGIGFERPATLSEVAVKLGVSIERVRQIQARALVRLKTPDLRRELDPYLP